MSLICKQGKQKRSDAMKAAQIGKKLSTFWTAAGGVTAIEYALLASLIATVIVGSIIVLGTAVLALYELVVAAFP